MISLFRVCHAFLALGAAKLVLGDTLDSNNFVVSGYFPDYRAGINVEESAHILTDLILYSIEPVLDRSILEEDVCCVQKDHYTRARQIRNTRNQTVENGGDFNIFVSIGGGGRSSAMKQIAATKESRSIFISDLKKLCLREKLNGVDFDWEQPATNDEYLSYMHLIAEAAMELHKHNIKVSVALHANQFLFKEVYDYVDQVNLMAYDMVVPNSNEHHASFINAHKAVDKLVESGCHPSKIVLGIPAYGRDSRNPGDIKTHHEVVDALVKEKNHDEEGILSIEGDGEAVFIESFALVKDKVKMAVSNKLKGIFIWEIGQDYREPPFQHGLILGHVENALADINEENAEEL